MPRRKNMSLSEEQIRDILALQERISHEIEAHESELELLKKNLVTLNTILKQSSFSKASSFKVAIEEDANVIPIRKGAEGDIIANAKVTPDKLSIIVSDNVQLDENTHPFKSFFLGRIIGEMEKKDAFDAQKGKIDKDSIINCIINKDGNTIREILIKNYREKDRVQEIINTVGWSFARMIENSSK